MQTLRGWAGQPALIWAWNSEYELAAAAKGLECQSEATLRCPLSPRGSGRETSHHTLESHRSLLVDETRMQAYLRTILQPVLRRAPMSPWVWTLVRDPGI